MLRPPSPAQPFTAPALARPHPLCVWNHPYTGNSNSLRKPEGLLEWASALSRRAATQIGRGPPPEEEGVKHLLSQLDDPQFDSLVSLLYDSPGALRPHVDDGLPGVGLSLSLGSACVFEYGGVEMVLSSGDVLIGAFGFVIHQVSSVSSSDTAPAWWRALPARPQGDVGTATFGRARCNLQLRRGRYFASRKKVNSCGCVNGTQSC